MLFEVLFAPFFVFGRFLISLMPNVTPVSGSIEGVFYHLLSTGLYFFGVAPFVAVINSVVFWIVVDFTWSVIEWCYKKIPGVD